MRILKIAGLGVATLVGLSALTLVWLLVVFDPNDYKADIERLAQAHTGRKLTLQGELSLSVFPWLALRMGAAQLTERAGFGGARESPPFVAFQSARLSVKLLPLLRGQVQIGEVSLQAPSIRLVTDAQGRHNWDDLAGAKTESAAVVDQSGDNQSGDKVSATIAGIEIQDGDVVLADLRDGKQTAIRGFSLNAHGIGRGIGRGIGGGQPFSLTTSFTVEQNDTTTPVKIAATVTADWENKRYTLDKLDMEMAWRSGGKVSGGLPIGLQADALSLDLAQQTLQLTGLQLSVGAAQLRGSLAGVDVIDAPKLSGHLALVHGLTRKIIAL